MIYVLIPAYNEAATIGPLLWKVRQLFTSFNREYQIVVVNDGSTDATEEILAPYTRALPLTLLNHRTRQGYARSMEALLREAVRRTDRPRRDLVITMQADFSESPDDSLELIKKLEGGADIVVADRRSRPGAKGSETLARRALAAMARGRLGVRGAADLVGTMRGYRLATIERLVKEHGDRPFLGHQGWAADLELLARAARHARSVESVPVLTTRSPAARGSRLSPLSEAWRAWRASLSLRGLPAPVLPEGTVPVAETASAAPPQSHDRRHQHQQKQQRQHGERPRGEGERRDRPPRNRPRKPRPDQQEGRPPRQHQPQPDAKREPAETPDIQPAVTAEGPAGAEGAPNAAGEGQRKRRRRRGRGRGRGRGQGQGPQGIPAVPPPSPPAA